MIIFIIIFYRQYYYFNNYELQQLVDLGFQSLDINFKDGLLEYDEFFKFFDMRDIDGKIYYLYRFQVNQFVGENVFFKLNISQFEDIVVC